MQRKELLRLAGRVLSLPTAPYHEQRVRAFVTTYCRRLGLRVEQDRAGNVIAKYSGRGGARPSKPLVFVAHMDHPGFEVTGRKQLEFLGGAAKEMFVGGRVRLFGAAGIRRVKIAGVRDAEWPDRKLVELADEAGVPKGSFGMWDVPGFRVRRGLLRAPAIDDVLGVVVVLAMLTELARKRPAAEVWGVFTRAEEVGFHGAIEIARAGKIPRRSLVISVEMSRQRPWARIGEGPVIRVGDRMTIFDGAATWFLQEVARAFSVKEQRALMDGGTCEATAFAAHGYRVGGLCLALGNYHNIGPNERARAEYVSVEDLEGLVALAVASAGQWRNFARITHGLRRRVEEIRRDAPRKL
jgi:putative aminopeptidase FrvX